MAAWTILVIRNLTSTKVTRQHTKKYLPCPPYVKDKDLYARVWVLITIIQVNGEMKNEDIVNLFIFNLHETIS